MFPDVTSPLWASWTSPGGWCSGCTQQRCRCIRWGSSAACRCSTRPSDRTHTSNVQVRVTSLQRIRLLSEFMEAIRKIWHQNSFYQNSDLNICVEIPSLLWLSSIKPNFKLIIGTRKSSTTSGNVRIWQVVSYMRRRAAGPGGRWRSAAGLFVTAARLIVALDVPQQGLVVRQSHKHQREGLHLETALRGRVTGETVRAAVQLVWAANSLETWRRFRKEPEDTADVCQQQASSSTVTWKILFCVLILFFNF